MTERILKGKEETITYEEAIGMAEKSMTELLFYLTGMVDDLTDDKEERATAKVNLSTMVGKMCNGYYLAGVLVDPAKYISDTFIDGMTVTLEDAQ